MLDNLRLEFKTKQGMNIEEKFREVKMIELIRGLKRTHTLLAKNGKNRLCIDTFDNFPDVILLQVLNVKRVVNNLITNSLKHTNNGTVTV